MKPNFICILQGMGERNIAKIVLIRNSRWPSCQYMVKAIQTAFSPELLGRILADILLVAYGASPYIK